MWHSGRGVTKDYVRAHVWFNLAGRSNDVARENRDEVAKLMTAEQLVEAQRLAREWLEAHSPDEQE